MDIFSSWKIHPLVLGTDNEVTDNEVIQLSSSLSDLAITTGSTIVTYGLKLSPYRIIHILKEKEHDTHKLKRVIRKQCLQSRPSCLLRSPL